MSYDRVSNNTYETYPLYAPYRRVAKLWGPSLATLKKRKEKKDKEKEKKKIN